MLRFMIILSLTVSVYAVDKPSSTKITTPRTSTTVKFGSGTLERRSDGSKVTEQKFGVSSIIKESSKGKTTVGVPTKVGNQEITRWSDGTKSTTQKIGGRTHTTHSFKDGSKVRAVEQTQGKVKSTVRSNETSSRSQSVGNTVNTKEKPSGTNR